MKIGQLLIRLGHVTPEQVDEAARAQLLYGGRIGTNLVDLGHLHLDVLAEALGQQHHLPCVLARHFDGSDPALHRRLPAKLAAELLAIPLAEQVPGVVAVAFLDPPSAAIVEQIGRAMQAQVVPTIAPELRLRYQLERVYGFPRPNRFLRIGPRHPTPDKATGTDSERNRRRYVRPLSEGEPEPLSGTLGRVEIKRVITSDVTPAEGVQIDRAETLDDALRGMRRATDRDRVVDLAVSCMRDGFDRTLGAGLFLLVRQEMAIGWRGFSELASDEVIPSIAIPLGEASVLQAAYASAKAHRAAPGPEGGLIDGRLWHLLGYPPPLECMVAPIKVQDLVVCLLYTHPHQGQRLTPAAVEGIEQLAEGASAAFLRLIRAAQR